MISEEPLVGIGLCVRNGAKYLRESLNALLAQTHTNFELLISDNASSDDTQGICEEYARKDKRIRYIRQNENIGSFANYDFVRRESRGDYFLYASDDDLWDPRFIEKCLVKLKEDPGAIVAFPNFCTFDDSGRVMKYVSQQYFPFARDLYARLKMYILSKSKYGKGTVIYGLWRKHIPADGILLDKHRSDMVYVFKMLCTGHFAFVPETIFFKRLPVLFPAEAAERKASLHFFAALPNDFRYGTVDGWLKTKNVSLRGRPWTAKAKEFITNRLQVAKYFYLYTRYSMEPATLTFAQKIRLFLWNCYALLRGLWYGYM